MSQRRRNQPYTVADEPNQNGHSLSSYLPTAYSESPVIPAANTFAQPQSQPQSQTTSGSYNSVSARQSVLHKRRPSSGTWSQPSYANPQAATPSLDDDYYYPAPTYASPSTHVTDSRRISSDSRIPPKRPVRDDRRDSISKKSPLQQLENALSKEEKRARLEIAESMARDRHSRSLSGPHSPSTAPDQQPQSANRAAADYGRSSGNSISIPRPSPKEYSNASQPRFSPTSPSSVQSGGGAVGSTVIPLSTYGTQPDEKRTYSGTRQRFAANSTDQSLPLRQPHGTLSNAISPATTKSAYHTPPQNASSPTTDTGLGIATSRPSSLNPRSITSQKSRPAQLTPSKFGFNLPQSSFPTTSDWDSIPSVKLRADDLDLMPVSESTSPIGNEAPWWEKNSDQQQRRSSARNKSFPIPSDANFDKASGQTYFRPQIYLQCGPLLRFRGIHKEQSQSARSVASSATKSVWKGSILIVTNDRKSDYSTPPTLRLFKQPLHLLPPPPGEVGEGEEHKLAPEYVDPVAGQTKISRVGKTLYVRPAEDLPKGQDLSRVQNDRGLFEEKRSAPQGKSDTDIPLVDGEQVGKIREVQAGKLYAEQNFTFWKFNIEIELGHEQQRVAYRINRGPAIGFWIPSAQESMNIAFYSCNGFSLSTNPNQFAGPDPLWRDLLNSHQTRPFHVMIGGGDQLYMDGARLSTKYFKEWAESKNPHWKHHAEFTQQMQMELQTYYLNRYCNWFSLGLFSMANSQIPMVNIWDDHDIMDGYGSYSRNTMESPVIRGVGAVAFKYYMLFQHHSVPAETEIQEPSWILGKKPGQFINQQSRSLFMSFGKDIAFLGLDCRTERSRNEILAEDTWEHIFDKLDQEIIKGETKHLLVLLGVPIAYPRLNVLEQVLTSRVMDPLKFIGRSGALGGFVNAFDGGVEILDDLEDHWTAKHHKDERNWFIQELQSLAAGKSVRITILSGDVHLAAVGQFFSSQKLHIPKDRDHRYMPNIISSAIVNTPPSNMVADVIGRLNKIHHLDAYTDENMVPIFDNDVDGKPRKNKVLLPRRNWCSIRQYVPHDTPHHSAANSPVLKPFKAADVDDPISDPALSNDDQSDTMIQRRPSTAGSIRRSLSLTRRRITDKISGISKAPPVAFYNRGGKQRPLHQRSTSVDAGFTSGSHSEDMLNSYPPATASTERGPIQRSFSESHRPSSVDGIPQRPNPFVRRPTNISLKQIDADEDREGHISVEGGLDIRLNVENVQGEPEGTTTDYRIIVPALEFSGEVPQLPETRRQQARHRTFFGLGGPKASRSSFHEDTASFSGSERGGRPFTKASAASVPTSMKKNVISDKLGGWIDTYHGSNGLDHQEPDSTPPLDLKQPLRSHPSPQKSNFIGAQAPRGSINLPRVRPPSSSRPASAYTTPLMSNSGTTGNSNSAYSNAHTSATTTAKSSTSHSAPIYGQVAVDSPTDDGDSGAYGDVRNIPKFAKSSTLNSQHGQISSADENGDHDLYSSRRGSQSITPRNRGNSRSASLHLTTDPQAYMYNEHQDRPVSPLGDGELDSIKGTPVSPPDEMNRSNQRHVRVNSLPLSRAEQQRNSSGPVNGVQQNGYELQRGGSTSGQSQSQWRALGRQHAQQQQIVQGSKQRQKQRQLEQQQQQQQQQQAQHMQPSYHAPGHYGFDDDSEEQEEDYADDDEVQEMEQASPKRGARNGWDSQMEEHYKAYQGSKQPQQQQQQQRQQQQQQQGTQSGPFGNGTQRRNSWKFWQR